MHSRFVVFGLVIAIVSGCAVVTPSNEERKKSFSSSTESVTFDQTQVLRGVYYILAIDADFETISFDKSTGNLNAKFGATRKFKQALCVAIDSRGYLLTSGHVLGNFTYVIGDFEGGLGVKRARTIFKTDTTKSKCDFAVIKIEANLPWPLHLSENPKIDDQVFAVVFTKNKMEFGGARDFASGRIQSINELEPSIGALIASTIPLREGDSGGPMLTSTGLLVGVTQGWSSTFKGLSIDYKRLSARPQMALLHKIIEEDFNKNSR